MESQGTSLADSAQVVLYDAFGLLSQRLKVLTVLFSKADNQPVMTFQVKVGVSVGNVQ